MCPPLGNTLFCMASLCICHSWISADSGAWHISQRGVLALFVPTSLVCRHQLSEAVALGTLMENLLSTSPIPLLLSFGGWYLRHSLIWHSLFFLEPSCFSSTPNFFSLQHKSLRCLRSSETKQLFLPAQQSLVPSAEDNSCTHCSQQQGCKGRELGYV